MRSIAGLLALVMFCSAVQATDVTVLGLFNGRALLKINGQQKLLKSGDSFADVQVIDANSERAILKVDGKRDEYKLGSDIHATAETATVRSVHIARDNSGQYLTTVSLNGFPLRALIDTGASMVAINQYTAAKLGLNFRLDGQPMEVSTAGGVMRAWRVKFRSVKIGEIEQHDIEGAVIEGGSPTDVLVGMTFLRSLSIRNESNMMALEARY